MKLADYQEDIALHEVLERPETFASLEESDCALKRVIQYLIEEEGRDRSVPPDCEGQWRLLRALLNIRASGKLPPHVLRDLDRLLWSERVKGGIVSADDIAPISGPLDWQGAQGKGLCLWLGDITCLGVDAIVNAANSELLGCFTPLHACIDNCIHSAAGPQLREDCAKIMAMQGKAEAPGQAKITRAYNLPARFVLHTVGPIVRNSLTEQHRDDLASCYRACLDLAAEAGGIRTLAFCCISTGVYRFPAAEAARIAVHAVMQWLTRNPDVFSKVVFDVFSQNDYEHYQRVLAH